VGSALLGNGNKSCIDDLPAALLQILRLSQSLSAEGDSGCIWNADHYAKLDRLFDGALVIDLKFKSSSLRLNNW
jgi:hypothetical protein